ncbi:hypothetical protein [Paenibacillus radicis (ex Xue et al. 2023)]|uniref:DUF4025 domain-containing protein n=1 Tax=Paenibacillus radicis (ex Xue et al. 2023) TaxID=2972489 RepID=A0ABT1YDQ9_9BACL|nr:hypothetical protein [Paenibacillus radicis (ex Xue et al. 2023)]MCR8631336.1 hypothetical protein [Paenibacillus radicis (ex Xue et al. 2023)]
MKNDNDAHYAEAANTAAGIPESTEQEEHAPTDMISETVSEIVDNVQYAFQEDED